MKVIFFSVVFLFLLVLGHFTWVNVNRYDPVKLSLLLLLLLLPITLILKIWCLDQYHQLSRISTTSELVRIQILGLNAGPIESETLIV